MNAAFLMAAKVQVRCQQVNEVPSATTTRQYPMVMFSHRIDALDWRRIEVASARNRTNVVAVNRWLLFATSKVHDVVVSTYCKNNILRALSDTKHALEG